MTRNLEVDEGKSQSAVLGLWLMRAVTLVIALWGGVVAFMANPINWKLYSRLTSVDRWWAWFSNTLIIVIALGIWWFGQRCIARMIIHRTEPNKSVQRTSATPPSLT